MGASALEEERETSCFLGVLDLSGGILAKKWEEVWLLVRGD